MVTILPSVLSPQVPDSGGSSLTDSNTSIINFALSSSELRLEDKLKFDNSRAAFLDNVRPDERQPILSHLDLESRNIIVKGSVYDEANRVVDVEEVVIIDWEFLCWVPNWIEPAAIAMKYFGNDYEEPSRYL
jgi:thiamine kinase-like enzyme